MYQTATSTLLIIIKILLLSFIGNGRQLTASSTLHARSKNSVFIIIAQLGIHLAGGDL